MVYLTMLKSWTKFLQASIIGAAVLGSLPTIFAEGEAGNETRENAKQQIYLSQMAKYPALSREFSEEIEANAYPRPAPSEGENLFPWQLEDYQELNKEFADTFSKNVSTREVPTTHEEVYLWQLEDYKELDKEFYHEHRREF